MILKVKLILATVILTLLSSCSAYQPEDYAKSGVSNKKSACVNMEPAQELKCKEREQQLLISFGADKNCNHPYDYEKNRCKNARSKQQKALDESLEKHADK
ncbi:hypothetical protein HII17_18100 [Thalassotalea sp. M1531]|uniref:Lipoprotein n=1 Tax=Thalassotalea algicola TaxID=2716224 RepID=A0A7Y0LFA5_9GAMM|nr:hypothetical protein [Thalassotalea algicola]NMP33463.1 hypothetical protein [Thalassotalea algicola]